MFYKKYVFETRSTRAKRLLRSSIFGCFFLFLAFILLCVYIPIFAYNENERSEQAFFQRAPDMIAVFTGDSGRIDYTLKKAEALPSTKIFITGVYAKNSLKTLLMKQGKNISVEQYLEEESHHIELDYLARNTIENGLNTIRYLKSLEKHDRILIISNDYHIYRISKIMDALKDDNIDYKIYFESIETNYKDPKNIMKLVKEVYKLIKSSTFLMFWDREHYPN